MVFWLVAVPAAAQSQLPDVDVVLVLEVGDLAGWAAVQDEVLSTPQPGPKPLAVSVAAESGRRSIALGQPRFEVALVRGTPAIKVTVHGKIGGGEAVGTLATFESVLIERQAAGADSDVGLLYGLSGVTARVLEMYVTRP